MQLYPDVEEFIYKSKHATAQRMLENGQHLEALDALEKILPLARVDDFATRLDIIRAKIELHRYEASLVAATELVEACKQRYGVDHVTTVSVNIYRATAIGMLGRFDESKVIFDDVVARTTRVYGPDHATTRRALYLKAVFLSKVIRKAEELIIAETSDDEGTKFLEAVLEEVGPVGKFLDENDAVVHINFATAATLAACLLKVDRHQESATRLEACVEFAKKRFGLESNTTHKVMHQYAMASLKLGCFGPCTTILTELLPLATHGQDDELTDTTAALLANVEAMNLDSVRDGA